MKNHKTILLLLIVNLIVAPSLRAQATTLPPLSDYVTAFQTENNKPDPTEIAYFANRSAVLLQLVGAYFTQKATDESDKLKGANISKMAETFSAVGILFDTNINKKSEDIIIEQRKIFLDFYSLEMKRGKLSHNTIFAEQIGLDFKLAMEYHPAFKEILESIKKNK